MAIDLRLPDIKGTDKEQLKQIRSYLYQLIPELQFALSTVNSVSTTSSATVTETPKSLISVPSMSEASAQSTFNSIKSLIIKSADIVDAYYATISQRLDEKYVAQSDFGTYAEETSQEIQTNSQSITQNFENTQYIIQTETEALREELKGYTDEQASDLGDRMTETATDLDGKIAEANARIDGAGVAIEDLGIDLDETKTRLDGTEEALETAKADMNEAIQKVSESISETDKLLESAKAQLAGGLDDLSFTLADLQNIVLGVTAYIRSGILYYADGGAPVYGIEIGQEVESDGERVFKKFSRFTSEKLSFFDSNDNEVAYLSDKKMYIGQAHITISLQVGGFIQLVLPNYDVVEKWIGG